MEFFDHNYEDIPVFVAGDFNEEPHNDPISSIMKASFQDLY